ncbi:hypothetical protein Tco_1403162 [Tanacetum coccineum]
MRRRSFEAMTSSPHGQAAQTNILNNAAFQTEDLDAYDSDCDDVSTAQAVLMANLSNYGSDVILDVLHSEPYHNDLDNQSIHAMQDFEQTSVVDFPDNKITSDSNIIPYSQYLQETQQEVVQDTNFHMYVIPVIDDEETLILEEVSRSKMLAKQNDPISKEKKINTTPINYIELNRLSEDFSKLFVPQQELHAEQAFWVQTSHPNTTNLIFISPLSKTRLLGQLPRNFQKDKSCDNQNALEIPEYFENNDLKAQLQAKDTTIYDQVPEEINCAYQGDEPNSFGEEIETALHVWNLNEDILKITIYKDQYDAYPPSRKIRYPLQCTPSNTDKDKAKYAISRETQYVVFKIWNEYNILEDIKRGPFSKKSPIRHIQVLGYAVSNRLPDPINTELKNEF